MHCPLCREEVGSEEDLQFHYLLSCSAYGTNEPRSEESREVLVRFRWARERPCVEKQVHLISSLAGSIELRWNDIEGVYESHLTSVLCGEHICQLAIEGDLLPTEDFIITQDSDIVYIITAELGDNYFSSQDSDSPDVNPAEVPCKSDDQSLRHEPDQDTTSHLVDDIPADEEPSVPSSRRSDLTELSPLYKELLQHQVLHGEPSWVPGSGTSSPVNSELSVESYVLSSPSPTAAAVNHRECVEPGAEPDARPQSTGNSEEEGRKEEPFGDSVGGESDEQGRESPMFLLTQTEPDNQDLDMVEMKKAQTGVTGSEGRCDRPDRRSDRPDRRTPTSSRSSSSVSSRRSSRASEGRRHSPPGSSNDPDDSGSEGSVVLEEQRLEDEAPVDFTAAPRRQSASGSVVLPVALGEIPSGQESHRTKASQRDRTLDRRSSTSSRDKDDAPGSRRTSTASVRSIHVDPMMVDPAGPTMGYSAEEYDAPGSCRTSTASVRSIHVDPIMVDAAGPAMGYSAEEYDEYAGAGRNSASNRSSMSASPSGSYHSSIGRRPDHPSRSGTRSGSLSASDGRESTTRVGKTPPRSLDRTSVHDIAGSPSGSCHSMEGKGHGVSPAVSDGRASATRVEERRGRSSSSRHSQEGSLHSGRSSTTGTSPAGSQSSHRSTTSSVTGGDTRGDIPRNTGSQEGSVHSVNNVPRITGSQERSVHSVNAIQRKTGSPEGSVHSIASTLRTTGSPDSSIHSVGSFPRSGDSPEGYVNSVLSAPKKAGSSEESVISSQASTVVRLNDHSRPDSLAESTHSGHRSTKSTVRPASSTRAESSTASRHSTPVGPVNGSLVLPEAGQTGFAPKGAGPVGSTHSSRRSQHSDATPTEGFSPRTISPASSVHSGSVARSAASSEHSNSFVPRHVQGSVANSVMSGSGTQVMSGSRTQVMSGSGTQVMSASRTTHGVPFFPTPGSSGDSLANTQPFDVLHAGLRSLGGGIGQHSDAQEGKSSSRISEGVGAERTTQVTPMSSCASTPVIFHQSANTSREATPILRATPSSRHPSDASLPREGHSSLASALQSLARDGAHLPVGPSAETEALRQERDTLARELHQRTAYFETEVDRLKTQNQDLNQQLLSLQTVASFSENENERVHELDQTVSSLRQALDEKEAELTQLRERCTALERANQVMQEDEASLRTASQLTVQDLNKANEELQTEIKGIRRKSLDSSRYSYPSTISSTANIRQENRELQDKVEKLEDEKRDLRQKYNRIKLELEKTKAEKSVSELKLSRAKSDMELSNKFDKYISYDKVKDTTVKTDSSGVGSSRYSWSDANHDAAFKVGSTNALLVNGITSTRPYSSHVKPSPILTSFDRLRPRGSLGDESDLSDVSDRLDGLRTYRERHRTFSSESSSSSMLDYEPAVYRTAVDARGSGGRRERPHSYRAGMGSLTNLYDPTDTSDRKLYRGKFGTTSPRHIEFDTSLSSTYTSDSSATTPYSSTSKDQSPGNYFSKPFAPSSPKDVLLGMRVLVTRTRGNVGRGVVKYVGPLPDRDDVYIGVELDTGDGKHDGSFGGRRFFRCKPNKGIFVSYNKVVMCYG